MVTFRASISKSTKSFLKEFVKSPELNPIFAFHISFPPTLLSAKRRRIRKGLAYLIACNISGLDMDLCDCAFGGAWCW